MPWHVSFPAGLSLGTNCSTAEPCGDTGSLPSWKKERGSFRALAQEQSPAWFLLRTDVALLASQRGEVRGGCLPVRLGRKSSGFKG